MAKINVSKGWDFNLDYSDKKKLARDLGIASWVIWFAYSTPTTMNFAWKLFTGVKLFGIPYLAQILGIFAALIIQWYEMKLVKLAAWKSWWIMIFILPCMVISILANVQLETIGLQTQKIKYDDLTDLSAMIDTKRRSIADDSTQIELLNATVGQRLAENKQPYTQTLNRIESFTESKNQKVKELEDLVRQKNEKANTYGPLVTIGDLESGKNSAIGIFLAIFLETLMVLSMVASIGIYQSEEIYVQEEKAKHDTARDIQALEIERENYRKMREEFEKHKILSASSLPQPITIPANGNGKSVQIYGENLPAENGKFSANRTENFPRKTENLGQTFRFPSENFPAENGKFSTKKTENFPPNGTDNNISNPDILNKIFEGESQAAKENVWENLLKIANEKRYSQAEKLRLMVIELKANFPNFSYAKLAAQIPNEFRVSGKRVGQILREAGYLRKDEPNGRE